MNPSESLWEQARNSSASPIFDTADERSHGGSRRLRFEDVMKSLENTTPESECRLDDVVDVVVAEQDAYVRGLECLERGEHTRAAYWLRKVPNLLVWCGGEPSRELRNLCEEEAIQISTAAALAFEVRSHDDSIVKTLEGGHDSAPISSRKPVSDDVGVKDGLLEDPRVVDGKGQQEMPLKAFELFRSDDIEFVRRAISRLFGLSSLELAARNSHLEARMHSRRLRDISVNCIEYGADVRIKQAEFNSFFAVQIPLRGTSHVRSGPDQICSTPTLASIVSPAHPLTMKWSHDCAKLILRVERTALEAHLSDMLNAPLSKPLQFQLSMDVSRGFGRSWRTSLGLLVDEIERSNSVIDNPVIVNDLENWLMCGLLFGQPNNYTRLLSVESPPASARSVRLAIEAMECEPEWPHTITSLSRFAGVSSRALQKGFRACLDTTPMMYLRDVRLRRVRDDLRASGPDVATVSGIAARWGFPHAPRFAALYRQRFGERPSETLRRVSPPRPVLGREFRTVSGRKVSERAVHLAERKDFSLA